MVRSLLERVWDALPAPVARGAFSLIQRTQALQAEEGSSQDGLPLPPRYLRVLTAGSAEAVTFQSVGRNAADEILQLALNHGLPLDAGAVLEFGVGCGRVARHVTRLRPQVSFYGCDIDPRLLRWARAHLPGSYDVTSQQPPLPYETAAFDLVYALSVFTHLHDRNVRDWLAELARVTRPGGLAILSHHDQHLPRADDLQQDLVGEGFAILREGAEGSNLLSTYLTAEGFVARAAPFWSLLQAVPSHSSGSGQALAVFRRTLT